MEGFPTVTLLTIIWAAVTVPLVGLVIYRSIVGLHEEDQIFLDPAEAALEQEQVATLRQIRRLDSFIKGFGWASGGLLLLLAGFWFHQRLF